MKKGRETELPQHFKNNQHTKINLTLNLLTMNRFDIYHGGKCNSVILLCVVSNPINLNFVERAKTSNTAA